MGAPREAKDQASLKVGFGELALETTITKNIFFSSETYVNYLVASVRGKKKGSLWTSDHLDGIKTKVTNYK